MVNIWLIYGLWFAINGGTPKQLVYIRKSHEKGWFRGTPFQETRLYVVATRPGRGPFRCRTCMSQGSTRRAEAKKHGISQTQIVGHFPHKNNWEVPVGQPNDFSQFLILWIGWNHQLYQNRWRIAANPTCSTINIQRIDELYHIQYICVPGTFNWDTWNGPTTESGFATDHFVFFGYGSKRLYPES